LLDSPFKPKYVPYPYQWDAKCKKLTTGSQKADSGNRLDAIELIAGISLLLQFKQITSGIPLHSTKPVSSRKCGKIIGNECEWAFCYQFFAAGAPCISINHIIWRQLLKLFFAI
jgi:hypothetical protein